MVITAALALFVDAIQIVANIAYLAVSTGVAVNGAGLALLMQVAPVVARIANNAFSRLFVGDALRANTSALVVKNKWAAAGAAH